MKYYAAWNVSLSKVGVSQGWQHWSLIPALWMQRQTDLSESEAAY